MPVISVLLFRSLSRQLLQDYHNKYLPSWRTQYRCSSPRPYQTETDCPRRLWQLSHWTLLSPGSTRSCKHQLKVVPPPPPHNIHPAHPHPIPLPTLTNTITMSMTQIFAASSVTTEPSTKWCWLLYGIRRSLPVVFCLFRSPSPPSRYLLCLSTIFHPVCLLCSLLKANCHCVFDCV